MIDKIELHNFQCHKTLLLELDKVTTLVGPSDSGKTAVLRAIDWVCFNRGRTALLLRRGAETVSAVLHVDGHRVTRTTDGNAYYVDRTLFNAIGRNIPNEVLSLLKMSEDNVQRQHDYLFWFTATGSTLVSNLNRVVDLTKLESWVKTGVSKERQFKERANYLSKRQAELDEERTSLKNYRDIDADLVVLEQECAEIDDKQARKVALDTLLADLTNVDDEMAKNKDLVGDLSSMLVDCEALTEATHYSIALNDILLQYFRFTQDIARFAEICKIDINFELLFAHRDRVAQIDQCLTELQRSQSMELVGFCEDLAEILRIYEDILKKQVCQAELGAAITALSQELPDIAGTMAVFDDYSGMSDRMCAILALLYQIDTYIKKEEAEKERINGLKEELQEKTGGICPVCGNALTVHL